MMRKEWLSHFLFLGWCSWRGLIRRGGASGIPATWYRGRRACRRTSIRVAGRAERLLGEVELRDGVNGSPMAANGVLYVATMSRLYAVAKGETAYFSREVELEVDGVEARTGGGVLRFPIGYEF
ncbi:MAG: hypothetical protein AAF591_06280 [Verrucomicrobiota bacterium]